VTTQQLDRLSSSALQKLGRVVEATSGDIQEVEKTLCLCREETIRLKSLVAIVSER